MIILYNSPYVFKWKIILVSEESYPSFAIGDEVDSEDDLQMDPCRGELDFF